MSMITSHITALNALIYNATAYATVAQNNASSPLTNLYLSLHTAWPGITGSQTTSEASYTGGSGNYARIAVARTSGGFTVSGRTIALAANAVFATANSAQNLFFWGLGSLVSGAGELWHAGGIGPNNPTPFVVLTGAPTIYSQGHGFTAGQTVFFMAGPSGSVPTGLTEGTIYYVIATGLTADAFQVSATSGGSAITPSSTGSGFVQYVQGFAVVSGYTPTLAAGTSITF